MNIAMLFADSVEDSAHSISDTAAEEQNESGKGNGRDSHLCGEDDTPSHTDITDH